MFFPILDDVKKLNAEEKAFVEDPANAHLFSKQPSTEVTGRKRSGENLDDVSSQAKKNKTSTDEVRE